LLFEVLATSKGDRRFAEWLNCFEIIFNITIQNIVEEHNELLQLVNFTEGDFLYDGAIRPVISTEHMSDDKNRNPTYNWITIQENR